MRAHVVKAFMLYDAAAAHGTIATRVPLPAGMGPRQVSQTKDGGRALAEPVVPFPGGIATNIPYEDRYPLELVQRDFKDPVEGATAQLLCAEEVAVLLELRDQLRTRDLGSAGDAPELSRHRRDDRPQAFWRGRR